jgi:hypothetical protein
MKAGFAGLFDSLIRGWFPTTEEVPNDIRRVARLMTIDSIVNQFQTLKESRWKLV